MRARMCRKRGTRIQRRPGRAAATSLLPDLTFRAALISMPEAYGQRGRRLLRGMSAAAVPERSQTYITMPYVLSRPFGFGFGQEAVDLFGEVLGADAGQAGSGDDDSASSPEPDEPGSPGRPSPGAGGAGIDLDRDGWHG